MNANAAEPAAGGNGLAATAPRPAMLSGVVYDLDGVGFAYAGSDKAVLDGVQLRVSAGDFLGVIGPNGVGKSTLLALMTGLLRPRAGHVQLLRRDLKEWARVEIARTVAVVPQREEAVFPFAVEEVVLMGRYPYGGGALGFEDDEDRDIARRAIAAVGLEGFERRSLLHLSGGERQLVLLARALAQQTPILLLDEPTTALDLRHQRGIFSLLEDFNRRLGITIVVVSHDINLAALYCREMALLSGGRFVARGKPADVLNEKRLSEVFASPVSVDSSDDGYLTIRMRR